MKKLDKKDYVCTQPFNFSEIFDHGMYMCCPNWLPVDLGDPNNIAENWRSDKAKEVRESMIDGSYKFCIESRCPKLIGLKEGKTEGFITKKRFLKERHKYDEMMPESLKYNFDRSCNLRCPSCRLDFVNYDGKDRERTEELLKNIEEQLGGGLKHIECTGSGDPFFSRSFRKWMMNFDPAKYPKLESMHLHTNGTLWNHSNWSRMKNIHKFVKSAEISIDAAHADTYENKTRIGGNWDQIISNLIYISELDTLDRVVLSFVVQKDNYLEMRDFYNLVKSIFKNSTFRWNVFYNRVVNWGTYTPDAFRDVDISDPNHPDYRKFLEEYLSIPVSNRVTHNLHIDDKMSGEYILHKNPLL